MAFLDLKSELAEAIPGLSRIYAGTLINRAWRVVRDSNLWSFQLQQGGFATPAVTTAGSVTATLGSNTVTGDATASAAWAALPFIFSPTLQQFRINGYSIYSIIAYTQIPYPTSFVLADTVTGINYSFSIALSALQFQQVATTGLAIPNPVFFDSILNVYWMLRVTNGAFNITLATSTTNAVTQYILTDTVNGLQRSFQVYAGSLQNTPSSAPLLGQLTLDRPFIDPLPAYTSSSYQMFLAYIAAPKFFKRWLSVADVQNTWSLDIWTDRRTINQLDPTRLYTSNPSRLLGLGTDMRPGSATLGQQLYELYPNPSTQLSYTTYYVIQSPDLVNNFDTLPYPITEEVVLLKARVYAYEWAESRKDVMAAKGSGANYGMLKKDGEAQFHARLKTLRLIDKDQVDSYNMRVEASMGGMQMPYYNSQVGRANMGGWR